MSWSIFGDCRRLVRAREVRWSEGSLSKFWLEMLQKEMSALRGPHDRPRPAIGMGSFEMAQSSGVRSGMLMMMEKVLWMESSCSCAYFWNLAFSHIWIKEYR